MNDSFIRQGDFCEIVSDKFIHENVKRGHYVYVAGLKALPISDNDPYTQRIKCFVHLLNGDHIESFEIYVMDPDSLQKVNKSKQKKLGKFLKDDFGQGSTN